jgi:hypothetical protein
LTYGLKIGLSLKHSLEKDEDTSTAEYSWNSVEEKKKRKYTNVYISTTYGQTNFGDADDQTARVSCFIL